MTEILGQRDDLKGIKGWLCIPAFIVATAPIFHALAGFEVIGLINRIASRVRSAFYLDSMISFILAGAFVYTAYLMWNHRREFPKWFIAVMVASVLKVLLLTLMMAMNGVNVGAVGQDFAQALVPAAIWVPYMLKSKRVAATFVN